MKRLLAVAVFLLMPVLLLPSSVIPVEAWSRDVGAAGYTDGAPIGGFGAGTITWKNNGDFYLTRLNIGDGDDGGTFTAGNANCKFYMYQKPASGAATVRKLDSATLGTGQATYRALFPFSWVNYHGSYFAVDATVTQFSPIIPNDYQRTSYPTGIYEWEISNPNAQSYDVAIMLAWDNPYGSGATSVTSGNYRGIVLNKSGSGAPTEDTQGEFCLASLSSASTTVSVMSNSTLANIVTDFTADGLLPNTTGSHEIGAIAFKVTLAPGATVRIPITVSWDIPIMQLGSGATGSKKWYRKYTRHWSRTGTNSWAIAQDSLANRASYESQIDAWQNGVLSNPTYPSWLKSMLFNELYIYFAGGTVWEAGAASGQADNPDEDMFSHLESYLYPFYGTSDVRFYGSWALFMNWPDIDKQAVKQFADSVYNTRSDRVAGTGSTAHDVGGQRAWNPSWNTCPLTGTEGNWYIFDIWDAYRWRSACDWKDLNSKLVLMVYRDWKLSGQSDSAFLSYCWEPVKRALDKIHTQDSDGDGLPNSTGIDQTYDDMDLHGDTAYCGGLYLAALNAGIEIAKAAGDTAKAASWQARFDFARPNFESELWNGEYYDIDTGSSATNRIMSDQLCGQWYSDACGLPMIVSNSARAQSAYQKIHDYNWQQFGGGAHGAVNVMNANGTVDYTSNQTAECWVGTSWGVVAGMIHRGMTAQANNIGASLYNAIWNTGQYWFRTPEAWQDGLTSARAYYYMRATAIWAVKHAYDTLVPPATPTHTGTATDTGTPTHTITGTIPTYTHTPTNTVTRTPTQTPTPITAVRVNVAGPNFTASDGLYAADQAYGGANVWGYTTAGTVADRTSLGNVVANTADDAMYLTERWAAALTYLFDNVGNGMYRVTLKFNEMFVNSAGARVFNVNIEGVTESIDVYALAGNTQRYAVDRQYIVTVTDGQLRIDLNQQVEMCILNAIKIETYYPPTPTYTNTQDFTGTFTSTATRTNTWDPGVPTYTNTPTFTQTRTFTVTRTPTQTPTSSFVPVRVNVAGPALTNAYGHAWSADQAYGGANTWGYVTPGATNDRGTEVVSPFTLVQQESRIYQTERWSNSGQYIDYTFDGLPSGYYTITLHFAEMYCAYDCREFNVLFEGVQQPGSVEPFVDAGGDHIAYYRDYTVQVTDGQLNLRLAAIAGRDWPLLNGIEIEQFFPTPTQTGTFTRTHTFTQTATYTSTGTATGTPSRTTTGTPTWTRTATETSTGTHTATGTSTFTWTATDTATGVPTPTFTATPSETRTGTATQTATGTYTASATGTFTGTDTPTNTRTYTLTYTSTATPSDTETPDPVLPTWTRTHSFTVTGTATATRTYTQTPTASGTYTYTVTNTATSTDTAVFTATNTRTATDTGTPTHTFTDTETQVPGAPTWTPTQTYTITNTATPSASVTATAVNTATASPSGTPTRTFTASVTNTATFTFTFTATFTNTFTATSTFTASNTLTHVIFTPSYTETATHTPVFTVTWTETPVPVPTQEEGKIVLFPHPYDGRTDLYCNLGLAKTADSVVIRIYTASFRLVREIRLKGPVTSTVAVSRAYFRDMGRGTYYFTVKARYSGGDTYNSKVQKLIILK